MVQGLSLLGCVQGPVVQGLSLLGCVQGPVVQGLSLLGCVQGPVVQGLSLLGCVQGPVVQGLSLLGCVQGPVVQCLSLLGCVQGFSLSATKDHLILSSVSQHVQGFGFCDLAVSGMAERCLGRRRDVFRGLRSSKSALPQSSFDTEQLYVGRAWGVGFHVLGSIVQGFGVRFLVKCDI